MATITELQNDFNTFKSDFTDALARAQAQIDQLKASQGIPAADQAILDSVDGDLKNLSTTAKAFPPTT